MEPQMRTPMSMMALLGVALLGVASCTTAEWSEASEVRDQERIERTRSTSPGTMIPAGAELTFQVDETVSSRTHEAGDVFTTTLTDHLRDANGSVLIPLGATARWTVTRASTGEGNETFMAFRLQSVDGGNGAIALNSRVSSTALDFHEKVGDSGRSIRVAMGTLAPADTGVLGAAVAVSRAGGEITIQPGSLISVRVTEATSVH